VPRFESARPLDRGDVYVRVQSSHASSDNKEHDGGLQSDFGGLFHEWIALNLQWAPFHGIEVGGRIRITGWDEHQDRFEVVDENGDTIVTDEFRKFTGIGATSRHAGFSDVLLQGKGCLWELEEDHQLWNVSLASSVKIPIGRDENLTHAGTTDANVLALATAGFGAWTYHANVGYGYPFGEQTLFEDRLDIDLNPFVHGAVGVNWTICKQLAAGFQIESNSSAFREVDFFDGAPLSGFLGLRSRFDRALIEVGYGLGYPHDHSYQYLWHFALGWHF
jgi:hypothetical protein